VLEGFNANGIAAGGQLTTTTDVENYPGFPSIQGPDLTDIFRQHGKTFGAESLLETVTHVNLTGTTDYPPPTSPPPTSPPPTNQPPLKKIAVTAGGTQIVCDSIIVATGALAKKLTFDQSDEYWQKGISACAVCDGGLPLFRNQVLVVIGGGDTAMEEALFLTRFASKVVVVHRRSELRASKIMADRALMHDKIAFKWNANVVKAEGNDAGLLKAIVLDTGEKIDCAGLFFGIGHEPATAFLDHQLDLDNNGYVVVAPGKTSTSVEGVYACGDVMDHEWRQAVTAAGTGCMAALEAERWLAAREEKVAS
jgi:thioredoxin reductase (NADPH)